MDEIDAWVAEEVRPLVSRICGELIGKHPIVQSVVLADLLAKWLAGHPNYMRAELLAGHALLVRQLIPDNERQLFKGAGHPGNQPVT